LSSSIFKLPPVPARHGAGTYPSTPHGATDTGPSFVRSRGLDTKTAPVAPAPSASKAQAVPEFSKAQLQAMGAEILALYKEKYLDEGRRYLNFSSEGQKYSIRGSDIENVLIHAKSGIVQLGRDGTPRPNLASPIADTQAMTLALMRTLATLRNTEASSGAVKQPAAS
jgi:hypothetical protein